MESLAVAECLFSAALTATVKDIKIIKAEILSSGACFIVFAIYDSRLLMRIICLSAMKNKM